MLLRRVVFLMALGLSAFVCADEIPSEIPVLRVGLPPFPPFAYPKESIDRGVVVDIFKMLEKELKIKVKIIYYPYPRVVESMKRGDLDLAIIFKNNSLKSYVTYIGELSKSKVLIIPDKNFQIHSYEDLYSLRHIAVVRRANFESRFDADTKINKFTVVSYKSGLRMLNAKRVDAIIGSQSGLEEALYNLEFESKVWGEPFVLNQKEWWLHLSNKSAYQGLIPDLIKTVEKIYRKDLVWELFSKAKDKRATALTPENTSQ
jgi:polar amino acid transport system substrate-binding protein